jgi:hypothetical protein
MGERLAQAVRNSLNLPRLRVRVRHNKAHNRAHRAWSFRLEQGRASSEWLDLNAGAVAVMKKVGLLPPLHLGVFRLAYAALQDAVPRSRKIT